MIQTASRRRVARSAGLVLSVLALSVGSGSKSEAQCTLLAAPGKFDPPASGLPSYLRIAPRPGALSVGGVAGTNRLAVRYNYGFLVYGLGNPGAPARTSIEDLLGDDHYPKNGDGQERAALMALSADGLRALQPWTDTAGYGSIAMTYSGGAFQSGGDFLPPGGEVFGVAIVKVGTRYLGFSITLSGIYAADITEYQSNSGPSTKNAIYSEQILNVGLSTFTGVTGVEAGGNSYVVAWSTDAVAVIDVSNPGSPTSGLTTQFSTRVYSASELGIVTPNFLNGIAAAVHPSDGALHLLTESGRYSGSYIASAGVRLSRVDPSNGSLSLVGAYQPPAGAKNAQSQVVLLPFSNDLVAFFLEGTDAGGLKMEAHSSADFQLNLAASLAPFSLPTQAVSLVGLRPSGGSVYLYMMDASATYVASLDCSTAPSPATASLSVDNVPYTGGAATPVADGGTVFIGDQLRVKPAFSPTDTVQPLLDWRLDYDFHDGNTLDSNATTYRLKQPDVHVTAGGPFPTQKTLIGPCDPAQIPQQGAAPDPATGAGCWESVTTNDLWTVPAGAPDFPAAAPVDKQLTIAFEAQNALNAGSSSVAKHRITWKVPRALLKSSAILSGGSLEDLSEGSPLTTGLRWYVSQVPVGQAGDDVLTLQADCSGITCTPSPALTQSGSYRYWVSVPYRGGFRTAECPGLLGDQVTCSGDAAKTVTVTDVVLSLTPPTQAFAGTTTLSIPSTSKKGTAVTGCPAEATSFSYNFCTVNGSSCTEGAYSSNVTQASPFGTAGSISIPAPAVGSWGLRIRYTYTTDGSCAAPKVAQWPASGWSPLTVLQGVPTIRLRNSSDTADIPKSLGIYWELTVNQTARLYAYLNDVRVSPTSLPSGFAWSRRPAGSGTETAIGTTQGASFSIPTAGDYEVVLRGFGNDVIASVGVSATTGGSGGSGGGGGVLSVTGIGFSPSSPTVGQAVTITCNATGGTAPYTYDIVYGDGQTYAGTSKSVSHVYSTSGGKTVGCAVSDSAGGFTNQYTAYLNVLPGSGGSCEFVINNEQGARISYDSSTRTYDAASGQPLTFVASGVTSSVNWNFGDGQTATGASASHTYNVTQGTEYTATMTSGSCSQNYKIYVSAPTGPSFTVVDASTGTPLAKPSGTWEARAGQSLRFTASGTTGAVSWDFGDGGTSTETPTLKTFIPVVDTTYLVRLTSNGLSKQENILVKGSTGAPLTGNFTFKYSDGTSVSPGAVQPYKAILFTAADQATTYTWDFGDGSALASGSPKEYTFTRAGNVTVKLTVARSGVPGTVTTPSPQLFTVLAPPDPLLWVAAGMAYADGGNGALWQSDLSIYNPGTRTATVSIGFVAGEGWGGASDVDWIEEAIPAGQTTSYSSVLSTLFRLNKGVWGVVLVRGDDVPVAPVIVSRTYNAANAATSGTFGLSVPAMSVAVGVRPQSAAGANFMAGLRHDTSFRTNLTVANLKDETAEVEVIFRNAAGAALGSPAKVTVEPRGVKQLNSALSAAVAAADAPIGGAGYGELAPQFSAEVKIKKGTGVYPYATVIDQGTGDSIVVTPAPRPSPTYRLPGILRYGQWVSDVSLLNPSAKERKVRLEYSYVKKGEADRTLKLKTLTLRPYEMMVWVDFFKSVMPEGDTGEYSSSFIDVSPTSDDAAPTEPLIINGKTYTASGRGTIGLQVDPYVFEDGIGTQTPTKRILLSGLEANQRFRTNVALFITPGATSSDSAQVDVQVFDSRGRPVGPPIWVPLTADRPVLQLSSSLLFGTLTTPDNERATIVISNPRGTARVGAYATVIDNLSEDAIFVAGQPAP